MDGYRGMGDNSKKLKVIKDFVEICLAAPDQGLNFTWLLNHLLTKEPETSGIFKKHFSELLQLVTEGKDGSLIWESEEVEESDHRIYSTEEMALLGEEGVTALSKLKLLGILPFSFRENLLDHMLSLKLSGSQQNSQLFLLIFLQSLALAQASHKGTEEREEEGDEKLLPSEEMKEKNEP